MASRLLTSTFAASSIALCAPCFGAHPLQTEDTGTQGASNAELENGFARARFDGSSLFTYQPQLSIGLSTPFDAILQPSFVSLRAAGQPPVSGLGDTNADAKWRFYGADPWSFAVRAGLELPTSQRGLGLPHSKLSEHVLLVATWDAAPTTVHANLGVTQFPSGAGVRATGAHASAALMQSLNERLILTVDGELDQDPDPTRKTWPGSLLGGAIYTLRPGLDVDVGYQRSLRAVTANRQWMAGLTYRFAL